MKRKTTKKQNTTRAVPATKPVIPFLPKRILPHEYRLRGGMPKAMGVRLVKVTRRRIEAEMPVRPLHLNSRGRVSGGALMAFGDMLGAAGTVVNLPDGCWTTTLESKTNFFGAGQPPVLRAVSIPLHIGKTTMVWQTTISNSDGRTVAIVTQTQIVLRPSAAREG